MSKITNPSAYYWLLLISVLSGGFAGVVWILILTVGPSITLLQLAALTPASALVFLVTGVAALFLHGIKGIANQMVRQ